MLGNPMLEVAIALGFFYSVLALVCSAVTEGVSSVLSLRARGLRNGIARLLGAGTPGAETDAVLNHPLVKSLGARRLWGKLDGVPDYIPGDIFARVVAAILPFPPGKDGDGQPTPFVQVRNLLPAGTGEDFKTSIASLIFDAGSRKEKLERIEAWYDRAMDRSRGWYAQRIKWITLGVAVLVVGAMNADTIMMTEELWRNGSMRAAIVAEAEKATSGEEGQPPALSMAEMEEALGSFPIGWHPRGEADAARKDARALPATGDGILRKLAGLLVTVFAVSLGAPFWFDLLNRLVNLRSGGKPLPTASDKEAAAKKGKASS